MIPIDSAGMTETWPSPNPLPSTILEKREVAGRVTALLERLPASQREVMYLKFQEGMSYKEISKVTQLSVSNVGFLIHTAVKTIRRQLANPAVN